MRKWHQNQKLLKQINWYQKKKQVVYKEGIYSYVRYSATEKLVIINNFSWVSDATFDIKILADINKSWKLKDGIYQVTKKLDGKKSQLKVDKGIGTIKVAIAKSESLIFGL